MTIVTLHIAQRHSFAGRCMFITPCTFSIDQLVSESPIQKLHPSFHQTMQLFSAFVVAVVAASVQAAILEDPKRQSE